MLECQLINTEKNEIRKLPFGNHNSNQWFRQESSMSAKTCGWMFDEEHIYTISKSLPQNTFKFSTRYLLIDFTVEKLGWHHLNQVIKINFPEAGQIIVCPLWRGTENMMSLLYHSWQNTQPESTHQETSAKPKLRDILQSNKTVILKTIKTTKDKERLRNYCRLKETKRTTERNLDLVPGV